MINASLLNRHSKNTINPKFVDQSIEKAKNALLDLRQADGHWSFELEADCSIPSEYILMMHYTGFIDESLQEKICNYLRRRQNGEGGWPLYVGGHTDLSCTVKAYYALKLTGDDPLEPHMLKARKVILQRGGAAKSNVFTRIALAIFEQIPWRGVPFIPAEIMFLPKWGPFHLGKISYWSRTVMVPLFILCNLKAKAKNPRGVSISELFIVPPHKERNYHPVRSNLNKSILILERIGFKLEGLIPEGLRKKALKKAEDWIVQRLNGTSGIGAIFPAMVNAYEALLLLGYSPDHPHVRTAKEAIDGLLVFREDETYCQPCVSPVWDTLLACCALQDMKDDSLKDVLTQSLDWLAGKQIVNRTGDWAEYRPNLRPGGWPFQYANDFYPDLDDSGFAGFALYRNDPDKYRKNILRAAEWLAGMQCKNGGFASFDVDNSHYYLNEIPFADHGALIDPSTSDVSARVLMFFGCIVDEYPEYRPVMEACLDYLFKEQEEDGAWYGRWGTNYIYGTWSVLIAFESAGVPNGDPRVRKAVQWLKSVQRKDGGWGEDNDTYEPLGMRGTGYVSTAAQTAWALLALMASGETHSEAVQRGIKFLLEKQTEDGLWKDEVFNAPGFPRVFYLKYHGYAKYFPLWALARYRIELKGKLNNTPSRRKKRIHLENQN